MPASFFFTEPATTEIYTLSLHDALPICWRRAVPASCRRALAPWAEWTPRGDRKSTRLNSSHRCISYAVFCLKKKKRFWLGLRTTEKSCQRGGDPMAGLRSRDEGGAKLRL